jgi:WD40 repeat protein
MILGLEGDETLVISGSHDCSVRIWRAQSGECIKSLYVYNPVCSLALLSVGNSQRLLLGSGWFFIFKFFIMFIKFHCCSGW